MDLHHFIGSYSMYRVERNGDYLKKIVPTFISRSPRKFCLHPPQMAKYFLLGFALITKPEFLVNNGVKTGIPAKPESLSSLAFSSSIHPK